MYSKATLKWDEIIWRTPLNTKKSRTSGNLFHITHSSTWKFISSEKTRYARSLRMECSISRETREKRELVKEYRRMRPVSTRDIHIIIVWQIDFIKSSESIFNSHSSSKTLSFRESQITHVFHCDLLLNETEITRYFSRSFARFTWHTPASSSAWNHFKSLNKLKFSLCVTFPHIPCKSLWLMLLKSIIRSFFSQKISAKLGLKRVTQTAK